MSHPVYDPVGARSNELFFTGRLMLYVEAERDDASKMTLIEFGKTKASASKSVTGATRATSAGGETKDTDTDAADLDDFLS